jgi:hypothetical protein
MEFGFTADEEAFRQEVRQFLRHHPPETFAEDGMDAGYGSGAPFARLSCQVSRAGVVVMTWPRAFGVARSDPSCTSLSCWKSWPAPAPLWALGGCDQTAESIMRYGSPHLQHEVLRVSLAVK